MQNINLKTPSEKWETFKEVFVKLDHHRLVEEQRESHIRNRKFIIHQPKNNSHEGWEIFPQAGTPGSHSVNSNTLEY